MDSGFGLFRPHQNGIASKQAQIPKTNIRSSEWAMFVRCGCKDETQVLLYKNISNGKSAVLVGCGHIAQYSGFKLATSTFVLSILHSAQYSGFKLATSTFVLSILEFIFIATFHKHCVFTLTVGIVTFEVYVVNR